LLFIVYYMMWMLSLKFSWPDSLISASAGVLDENY
jgi:hypothetical protein